MTRRSKAKDPNGPMTMCGMYINPFNHSVELMKEYLSKHKAMLFVKGQVIFPECISQNGIEPISVAKVYFENVLQQLKGHSPSLAWGRNLSNNDKCIQYNFYLLLTTFFLYISNEAWQIQSFNS